MPKVEKLAQNSCKNDQIVIDPSFVDQLNVFRELTFVEMKNIERYVYRNFKIRRSNFYYSFYNSIFIQNIELYLPNKDDVLFYLDKSGKQPEREARVTIVHYPFNVTYYIIGPVGTPYYHKLAQFSDRENPLNEFATGMYRRGNIYRFNRFSKQISIDLWPLMKDTYEEFEGYVTPQDLFKAGLTAFLSTEPINRENEIYSRIFWSLGNSHHDSHMNQFSFITVLVNITSKIESKWSIIGVSSPAS